MVAVMHNRVRRGVSCRHREALLSESKSRAAVLVRYQEPLEIRSYPTPGEAGAGEALVRVDAAGICGTDVHLWLGQLKIPLPVILGHETVGRIQVLGAGLQADWRGTPLAVGNRVTWASSIVCGECYYCRIKRQPTRCVGRRAYGISYCADEAPHLRGGYAEHVLLRAGTAIFRIPDAVSSESVVGAGCGLTTALHGLERMPVVLDDVVVVQGVGPVGMAAVAIAHLSGASRVIAIGGPAHRLERALAFGADEVVSIDEAPTAEARRKCVMDATSGFGADMVIECVGHPEAVPEGLELCRDGGAYLVLGQYADAGNVSFNPHTITRKQLRLAGSWGFEPRHVDRVLRLLERKKYRELFERQVTHRFTLDRANEALETVRRLQSGKALIVPGAE
jgi:threonine dehydrogenase-like Zn-dependent dehydrogenase